MRSFLFRRLTLVLVAGLTVTSAACNSVLGIDEARYDAALDPVAAPPAGAAGGSSGAGGAGGATEPGVKGDARCLAYCSLAMSNCPGELQPYPSLETCQAMCERMENGPATDQAGNTVECRMNHAGLALSDAPDKVKHCLAAGPLGNNTCGKTCDSFCDLNLGWCKPPRVPVLVYPSGAECRTACAGLKYVERSQSSFFSVAAENTLNCRDYHLQAAFKNDVAAGTHCDHTAVNSSTCF